MPKTQRVPERSQVKEIDTWDLTPLFKDDAAWRRGFNKLKKLTGLYEEFRGTLGRSAKRIRECYDFNVEYDKLAERLGSYAFLKQTQDMGDPAYQGMVQEYTFLATRAGEAASFIGPEIQAIPKRKMAQFMKSEHLKPYKFNLEKLLRYKPHILSMAEERILAMQGEVAGTADEIFGQLNDVDMQFGTITNEKGEEVELSHASFAPLLESRKRSVRKKAFHQFYAQYDAHKNTIAASLAGSVKQDVYGARVRNYSSAREAALFRDRVPVSVYDNLVSTVHKNLKHVHRFYELRRKLLKLKDIHHYDCYVPIVSGVKVDISYEEAARQICEAFEPLGPDYVKPLREGLVKGRWVDRYENKGKRSGAFSAGGYTGPPYMMMNYKPNTLNGIFTLAHEAGHSMHTYFSARNQPFHLYNYTIFVAEVASTFNEQLLGAYMRERAKSKKMLAYLINKEIDEIRNTLVRQTMFAEFETIIHTIAEAGEPLTLERMRAEYRKLLDAYFGKDFTIDDELELECLRIPHFYRAFYVYKYATGISAAIALHNRVTSGGTTELDDYLNFLRAGGSKYPLDIMRDAGVDLEDPAPVRAAMKKFGALVDELEDVLG